MNLVAQVEALEAAAGKEPWQLALVKGVMDSHGIVDADGYEVVWKDMHEPNARLAVLWRNTGMGLLRAGQRSAELAQLGAEGNYTEADLRDALHEIWRLADEALTAVARALEGKL